MTSKTILVVGATGQLGTPVVRQLVRDGFEVRALARDLPRARARLGPEVALFHGDVDDAHALSTALAGCAGVHISLAASDPSTVDSIEHRGTARVAQIAARQGVSQLTYLSGMYASADLELTSPTELAKVAAERAIVASGIAYTVFKPTYFMETLPRHVQGRRAIVLGRQPHKLHMIAGDDFARMVSRAFTVPAARNRELFVQGPEAITIAEALKVYCARVRPDVTVSVMPLPLMSVVNRLVLGGKLDRELELMRLMQRLGERGDPTVTNQVLAAPSTRLEAWCAAQPAVVQSAPSEATARGS